jgi:site-specific recombinase XerD
MLPEVEQFQKWLRRKYPHTSTPLHYISDLELFFGWARKTPGEITLYDIDAFIDDRQQAGHCSTTINRRLAALRSFYWFLEMDSPTAPANPVLPRRHFIRPPQRLPRDAQDVELRKLFSVITAPRDRAMFLLMLRCGLRVNEVRTLTLTDLYLQPTAGSLPRLWLHGKGGKERVAYLSAQPLAALNAWLHERPGSGDQAVFLNRFGACLTVTGIQDRLAHYCHEAQVWITCHQFRHTFGRHLVEAQVPVTSIQHLLGHAHLRTSEIYMQISDRQTQADYDAAMKEVSRRLPLEGRAA